MKFLIALALLAVAVSARPDVAVKTQELDITPEGSFKYNYELDDGTAANAEGDANNVSGSYKYKTPEGENVEINYVADAFGYQPQGTHVPAQLAKIFSYIRSTYKA
ncbi:larval cuticle protein LCP-17-like [Armigeres subalbatus]|uniref:larval cuticle protein LCP-17-like n=1 Tax=Armigeres subalbatus TaxID=124917 RepID=UPI002ECFCFD2